MMTTAMMMERAGMGTMGMPGMGAMGMPGAGTMPAGMNMMMVPRCTMAFEKCAGGMKIMCRCEDKTAAGHCDGRWEYVALAGRKT